jgi:hypothetical protein
MDESIRSTCCDKATFGYDHRLGGSVVEAWRNWHIAGTYENVHIITGFLRSWPAA